MLSEEIKCSLRQTIAETINKYGPPPDGGNPPKIVAVMICASRLTGDSDGFRQLTDNRLEAELFVLKILRDLNATGQQEAKGQAGE